MSKERCTPKEWYELGRKNSPSVSDYHFNKPDRGFRHISECIEDYFKHLGYLKTWNENPKKYKLYGDKEWYSEIYLKSRYWDNLRHKKICSTGSWCERCEEYVIYEDAQVHHKTYERLGFEWLEDLEVLCKCCHEKEHGVRRNIL